MSDTPRDDIGSVGEEAAKLLGALQDDEVPPLGLAGAGRPRRQVDQTVEHSGFERAIVERTGHPACADDLGELGHDIAVCASVSASRA